MSVINNNIVINGRYSHRYSSYTKPTFMSVGIDSEHYYRVRKRAVDEGVSMRAIVEAALDEFFKRDIEKRNEDILKDLKVLVGKYSD